MTGPGAHRPVALVVANRTDVDAGYVGERLADRGFTLRTVLREDSLPGLPDAGPVDLVLLLGSEWSVHSPVAPGALAAERALVCDAVSAGTPVLGLCYGAQLVASALGGSVAPAAEPEAGPIRVDTVDPVLVPAGPWTAFHADALTAPPASDVVATNDCGVQAFTLPGVLGVQFHPEVRPWVLADWAARFPRLLADAGTDAETLVAGAEARERTSRRAAHALVDVFLARNSDLLPDLGDALHSSNEPASAP